MKELSDDQLAVAIPTAFPELFPDAWKHDWNDDHGNSGTKCLDCGMKWYAYAINPHKNRQCPKPTPIVIDWNTAHRVVRECDSLKVREQLMTMWLEAGVDGSYWEWLISIALPADYLRAALLAKGAE
ncbi:hypothetical protein LCGC14_0362450 [marine sediment metagenome]|uniref:Uncharacterized protein n=1 Tax=marine sediment metagenome TaxID=412755 RepID=A0A0F9TQS5_9ZZZZ